MSVIGLDIGTTRIKALLHDEQRPDLPVAAAQTPVIASPDGDLRDAEAVVHVARECIAQLVAPLSAAERSRVDGIGIASLSEEVVLTDGFGLSVAPMPTWYATVMRDESERAGLNPSFSWSKLRWAREHLPAEAVDAVRGVTSLAGYVAARLAADATPSMEYSHASRTGFFAVDERRWDAQVFETSGWSAALLPELEPSGSVLGAVAAECRSAWGIPATAAVAVCGHDHLCAAFAAGVRRPGRIFLSSGTSEAHLLLVDDVGGAQVPEHVQIGRFVDDRSFYLHAHLPSGHLHAHLTQLTGGAERLAELEHQALDEPIGANGLVCTPRVGADPGYSVRGLSAHAGAASFVRAAQEGMALAAWDLDEALAAHAGETASLVIATGAATANPLWRRIRASAGVAPLEVTEEPELTALGAALVFRAVVLGEDPEPVRRVSIAGEPDETEPYRRLRSARIGMAGGAPEEADR